MQTSFSTFKSCLLAALVLSTLTVSQAAPPKEGNMGAGKMGQGKKDKKGLAMKRVELIAGHPLTPSQVQTIRAAGKERQKAMKPIQDKFVATLAKTLGISTDEFKKREKAVKDKEKKK